MGIFTKRTFLTDGCSFFTSLRITGKHFGPYSMMLALDDISDKEKTVIFKSFPEIYKQSSFVRVHGFKALLPRNDVYTCDFFDDCGKMNCSVLVSPEFIMKKEFLYNYDQNRRVETLNKRTLCSRRFENNREIVIHEGTWPISVLNTEGSFVSSVTVRYKDRNPKDYDIKETIKEYTYFEDNQIKCLNFGSKIKVKTYNGRCNVIYVNVNHLVNAVELDEPSGRCMWIVARPFPIEQFSMSDPRKSLGNNLVAKFYTTILEWPSGERREVSEEALHKIYCKLTKGEHVDGTFISNAIK